jgi:hypothetical protein
LANYTSLKVPSRALKLTTGYGSPSRLPIEVTLPAGSVIASADTVDLFDVPAGHYVSDYKLEVVGTLGASCTVQPRIGTRALGTASTAATASNLTNTIADYQSLATAARSFNLLVAGAAITTASVLRGHVELSPVR